MLGRLMHRADFEQLLASPPRWRSAHFAVHHVGAAVSTRFDDGQAMEAMKLSTEDSPSRRISVDNCRPPVALGILVPKRHARRAVTRNLIRRVVRAVVTMNAALLPAGRWLVRLKAPFPPREFVSAASPLLAAAIREELGRLLASVTRRPARGGA